MLSPAASRTWLAILIVALLGLIIALFVMGRGGNSFANTSGPNISISDPSIGSATPTVTVFHYANVSCANCSSVHVSLLSILDQYPEDMLLVWKDFQSTTLHPEATYAAAAARCADDQEAFWPFVDKLFASPGNLTTSAFLSIAESLELKSGAFERCVSRDRHLGLVDAAQAEGEGLSITATPTVYINGDRYTGARSQIELRNLIQSYLP
jgi:protein-disulfide isomerase